jgi:hypothetical protein
MSRVRAVSATMSPSVPGALSSINGHDEPARVASAVLGGTATKGTTTRSFGTSRVKSHVPVEPWVAPRAGAAPEPRCAAAAARADVAVSSSALAVHPRISVLSSVQSMALRLTINRAPAARVLQSKARVTLRGCANSPTVCPSSVVTAIATVLMLIRMGGTVTAGAADSTLT